MPEPTSPAVANEFGIATLSLGNWREHRLQPRLEAASKAGYQAIDLFDECWAAYLEEHGLPGDRLQVLRNAHCLFPAAPKIEGIKDPAERREALDSVSKRFPFMRAFDTDLVFMCANTRTDRGVTPDLKVVARDLAELGDMAAAYAKADGGPMLRIGYEGLSWATRNTWSSSWEAVRFANRPNVGLVLDAFNVLAVEFADPHNPAGHGRIFLTLEESIGVLTVSLTSLVATVPEDHIFFFQCGDAELVNPATIIPPSAEPPPPALLAWSRGHRLYPLEQSRGGYLPVELVAAAVMATGYHGPISLEVFNHSLNRPGQRIPEIHAVRGIHGLHRLIVAANVVPPFWSGPLKAQRAIGLVIQRLRPDTPRL